MIVESIIPDALDGERLDRAVAVIVEVTRSDAASLVDRGAVSVNGAVTVRRSLRVRTGDLVNVDFEPSSVAEPLVPDASVVFDVVYEDANVIVIDKPAGLVVHPGAGNQTATLVHGLLARFPELARLAVGDQAFRPGIVHRLDKGTSGLLMVGRTPNAVAVLIGQLRSRSVSRHYLALARGEFRSVSGVIDAPVGRSDADPTKMTVSVHGREAITNYRVRDAFQVPEPTTLVECWLETGRTHQIRVHLSAIGHPVVGDQRYGGSRGAVKSARPWLHAFRLSFDDPVTGVLKEFESPVPPDLQVILATLS